MCFFFRVLSGIDELLTTDSLSQKTLAGPSIRIPIILSLYQSASSFYVAIRKAMKEELSTVFCRLENQSIGALFK